MPLSRFPGVATTGRPAAAARLRRHADRLDTRAQILLDLDSLAAHPRPTPARRRHARRLAQRYADRQLACATLRALAALHDARDVPPQLATVTTPAAVERLLPLVHGAARAASPDEDAQADALAALGVRPGPLPQSVARLLERGGERLPLEHPSGCSRE